MYYYKTTIQYQGTDFAGFQWQKEAPTVQGEFNNSLAQFINGKITTVAASRTDKGVHAMEQVVKISAINPIECSSFIENINKALSPKIKCININTCDGLFRPASNAISKEYRYLFTNNIHAPKDETCFIANISNKLDLELIKFCAQALVGKHDFCNFYSRGSNVKSTVRDISHCELSNINPHNLLDQSTLFKISKDITHCYELRIQSNGFLKQMIRHIVSALWMVGSGKLSTDEFIELLNGKKNTKQHWKVAPPNGLFLYRIYY